MNNEPWKDWIPGVLSNSQLKVLCDKNIIENVKDVNKALDYSSIDLTLSNEGYIMKEGSVKPFGARYLTAIKELNLCDKLIPSDAGEFILNAKNTYLFKLTERLGQFDAPLYGQATAKSSIGRVDVLARLIVDGMDCYEGFDDERSSSSSGEMYLEITPMTFSVKVKEGISLSQLRLFYDKPEYSEMKGETLYKSLLYNTDRDDGSLSVDLSEVDIFAGNKASAFCAIGGKNLPPIPLWGKNQINPKDYWTLEKKDPKNRLIIRNSKFYILKSKEKISLPNQIAVYCRATDETIGEMRIHYAGFVHPCFGKNRSDNAPGTPLIFEVRGHDVDVNLNDGEKMARLVFYRMSMDCQGNGNTDYNDQCLKLSKFFMEWPTN